MFKTETVWDPFVMTKGTVVRLEGFSPMNNFHFKGLEYKVKGTQYVGMVVQSKNGKEFRIETWEIGDDSDVDLKIEIVSQVPYEMPF